MIPRKTEPGREKGRFRGREAAARGVIRVFPATPWRWHDAAFKSLRAEGGHRVSARRENGATTWLRVVAGKSGRVRIRDNFGGRTPQWSVRDVRKSGADFEVYLRKGQVLEAWLPRPKSPPPAPANPAVPVVIGASPGA